MGSSWTPQSVQHEGIVPHCGPSTASSYNLELARYAQATDKECLLSLDVDLLRDSLRNLICSAAIIDRHLAVPHEHVVCSVFDIPLSCVHGQCAHQMPADSSLCSRESRWRLGVARRVVGWCHAHNMSGSCPSLCARSSTRATRCPAGSTTVNRLTFT